MMALWNNLVQCSKGQSKFINTSGDAVQNGVYRVCLQNIFHLVLLNNSIIQGNADMNCKSELMKTDEQ